MVQKWARATQTMLLVLLFEKKRELAMPKIPKLTMLGL